MNIEIHYCAVWNYKPRAASLAEELKRALGIDARLIAGRGGVFDVFVDGNLVFSKARMGRYPYPGEILQKIKPNLG